MFVLKNIAGGIIRKGIKLAADGMFSYKGDSELCGPM
jgi:hypothetical protein